jgi:hypothetical protein
MVIPENSGAYRFWKAAISQYTDDNFTEYQKKISHFGNSLKNIFLFNSAQKTL